MAKYQGESTVDSTLTSGGWWSREKPQPMWTHFYWSVTIEFDNLDLINPNEFSRLLLALKLVIWVTEFIATREDGQNSF